MHWWLPDIPFAEKIVRSQGVFRVEGFRAAVLEPSGKLSVLKMEPSHSADPPR